jgi:ketosteroid isomerase-like protein
VKTVYDLYHWDHPDACAEVTYGFETREGAAQAAGIAPDAAWERVRNDNGWIIDPHPVTGRQTEWGVFERQAAETDTERVQLALDLLAGDGQTDGDHHKAWVIDQTVRILAGEGYDAWIERYRGGEDGPDAYSWDRGIAP